MEEASLGPSLAISSPRGGALVFQKETQVRVSPCGYLCGAPDLSRFFLAFPWRAQIFYFCSSAFLP